MTRPDHVSLYPANSRGGGNATAENKKLRKRKELDAMTSKVRNSNKRPTSGGRQLLQNNSDYFTSSADDDRGEDEEDSMAEVRGGGQTEHTYLTLVKKSSSRIRGKHRKLISACHGLCLAFVLISGFVVLVTITWLHFALRAQTQTIHSQIFQGSSNFLQKIYYFTGER